ncbi:MAG: NAD-dependent epimerase/dehydratase family protein [Elusimicrobia bacterium]|nr:NAD-dependent epimerase/dehydratase family protein [Elusimicrobiota bacterium]
MSAAAKRISRKALVTGGAGFIGSHVVSRLLRDGWSVVVYDDFRTGRRRFLAPHAGDPRLSVVAGDALDARRLHAAMAGADAVFHLQANADVRGGPKNTRVDLDQNTIATWNVLEGLRRRGIGRLVFSSSAVVYGEPDVFPTPEGAVTTQTSLYGASKLACEAMIQAYSSYYGIRAEVFRFVSWIGENYSHGVIYDFFKKLKKDPRRLEILGDGRQRKSYLYVGDGVDGIFTAFRKAGGRMNTFNLGHRDFLDVRELARIVVDEMGLRGVRFEFAGGRRGWPGDAPFVHLDVSKMRALGWTPRTSIEEGVRRTVRFLAASPWLLRRA